MSESYMYSLTKNNIMNQALSYREQLQLHAFKVVHRSLSKTAILIEVSEEYGLPLFHILSGVSADSVVVPRSIAHLFMMLLDGYTLKRVGHELGQKNYSTVIHGLKSVVKQYDAHPVFRKRVDRIREGLGISQDSFNNHIKRWRR